MQLTLSPVQDLGLALVSAVVITGISFLVLIRFGTAFYQQQNGPWKYNALVGGVAANPYIRAMIAITGLLALNQTEAIYLLAQKDSEGNPLRADHTYRVEGEALDSRWWSLTAYGPDGFLIPNDQDRYSYNSVNVIWLENSRFMIHLSRSPQQGNWIPLGNVKSFDLLLRLYNPNPALAESILTARLPKIRREDHDDSP